MQKFLKTVLSQSTSEWLLHMTTVKWCLFTASNRGKKIVILFSIFDYAILGGKMKFSIKCFFNKFKKQPFADVLQNRCSQEFPRHYKQLCWSIFLIKLQAWRPAIFKKRLQHRCFCCEYCEIFKNSFFIEHIRWLLLNVL